MDLGPAIRDLRAELEALDRAIASLEELQKAPEKERRGRKGMGEEERRIVSQRMKRYWASRHKRQGRRDKAAY